MSLLLSAALAGSLNCWAAAAYRYYLPAELLYAIGSVESSHDRSARAVADNGTYSVGLMQINSSWFSTLRTYGIEEHELLEPCINIQVGAWILRQEVDRYGYSWEAIGAYYAGAHSPKTYRWKIRLYRKYATKVIDRWQRLRTARRRAMPAPSALPNAHKARLVSDAPP
ncbi:MAG TPA: lytic transglycosylase domain-containing protein [Vicinamibacterales bacterium]|nr:lytic transglycosylase domain-containing protein [Vicinamibacterales bacterium]